MDQFIGCQIDGIHYLDSYKFLSSSLDDLVKNLHNDGVDCFKYMRCTFSDDDLNIFEKGVYPYEYMTSHDVFKQTSLPSMLEFYSKLKNGRNNSKRVQKNSRGVIYIQMRKYERFSQCLRQARCRFVGRLYGKFSMSRHTRIWNRSSTMLDVSQYTWQCCLKMTNL